MTNIGQALCKEIIYRHLSLGDEDESVQRLNDLPATFAAVWPSQPVGVGLVFRQSNPGADQEFVVVSLVPGRPAALCGKISLGDCLIAVDDVPCAGLSLAEVISRIVGPCGTRVKLSLASSTPAEPGEKHVWLVRAGLFERKTKLAA